MNCKLCGEEITILQMDFSFCGFPSCPTKPDPNVIIGSTLRIRLPNDYKVTEENKMTRDEAVNRMMKIFRSDVEDSKRNIVDFVDGLEALGLLKFDDSKQERGKFSAVQIILASLDSTVGLIRSIIAESIINDLLKNGYKIVDTDVCDIVDKRKQPSVNAAMKPKGEQQKLDYRLLHHCATRIAEKMNGTIAGNWVGIAAMVLEAEQEFKPDRQKSDEILNRIATTQNYDGRIIGIELAFTILTRLQDAGYRIS